MMLLKILPRLQEHFDNRVCCIVGHGPMGKRLEDAGVSVVYLELKNVFDFGAVLRFRRVIKEFQPNILVTYLIHADLFGRIFGRLFGIKKIICNQRGKLLQWEFLRIIDRATKFLVTAYVVQTETAKHELMEKLRLPEEKFTVIPNAIDSKEFEFELDKNRKRAILGLLENDIVITCVSRLRRGKGHEYLFEAFENIHNDHQNTKLLIVGDGEQKQAFLNQTKNYPSKSDILFLGNRDDVKELLKISDIFILPTLGEGMSNSIMEAMASELPIITTDIPENRELIENRKTGILVPIKDASSLAKATKDLLDDIQQRRILGENSKKNISKNLDTRVVILKLTIFLNEL